MRSDMCAVLDYGLEMFATGVPHGGLVVVEKVQTPTFFCGLPNMSSPLYYHYFLMKHSAWYNTYINTVPGIIHI